MLNPLNLKLKVSKLLHFIYYCVIATLPSHLSYILVFNLLYTCHKAMKQQWPFLLTVSFMHACIQIAIT